MPEKQKIQEIKENDLGETLEFLWNLFKDEIISRDKLSISGEEVKLLKTSYGNFKKLPKEKIPTQSSFFFKIIEEGQVFIEKIKQGYKFQYILTF